MMKPIQQQIEKKLKSLNPTQLEVVNESHNHSGGENKETHFNIFIVSTNFEGEPQIKRHRLIYEILSYEMQNGVHALALKTYTPEEAKNIKMQNSPPCLGGSKKL